jgi:mannosyltransferase
MAHISDKRFALVLGLITLLGASLRVYLLGHRSLWLDETFSFAFISRSWEAILTNPVLMKETSELNPPLYFVFLACWTALFGMSEFALRSLSVVFGVVAITLTGVIGSFLYDRRTGLLAALFMAVMVFPLRYSQEARGYALFLMLALGSFYFCVRCLQKGQARDWFAYLSITVALSYTHTYWVFPVLAQNLYVLLFYWAERVTLLRWIGTQTVVALCFLPWLPQLFAQVEEADHGQFWLEQPSSAIHDFRFHILIGTLQDYVSFRAPPRIVWAYLVLVAIATLCITVANSGWQWRNLRKSLESYTWEIRIDDIQRSSFLLLWLFCSLVVPFVLSQFTNVYFHPRYTIAAIPALYLLLARGVRQIPTNFGRGVIGLFIAVISLTSLQRYYERGGQREPWREWVTYLTQQTEPEDVVVVFPDYASIPVEYYAKGTLEYHILPKVDKQGLVTNSIGSLLDEWAQGRKRLWFVAHLVPGRKSASVLEYLRNHYQLATIESAVQHKGNPTILRIEIVENSKPKT